MQTKDLNLFNNTIQDLDDLVFYTIFINNKLGF